MVNLAPRLKSATPMAEWSEPLLAEDADAQANAEAPVWQRPSSSSSKQDGSLLPRRLWTPLLATLSLLILAVTLYSSRHLSTSAVDGLAQPKRVWIRAIEDNHSGLGSVVGQTRMAAALARALEAELVIPAGPTGHNYDAADYLNRYKHLALNTTRVCVLSQRLERAKVSARDLITSMSAFCKTGELSEFLGALQECTLIIDDRPWEYRRDFGLCTMDWLDSIVQVPPPPPNAPSKPKTTVALHVRWGDTIGRVGFDQVDHNATLRSIPFSIANPLINKLASCRTLDLHLYMEGGNSTIFPLDHPFTLHDGMGVDAMDDLRSIASADVRISALGGFASLMHWSARHGLSIVPSAKERVPPLYIDNERIKVAYQGDLLTEEGCETLEEGLRAL